MTPTLIRFSQRTGYDYVGIVQDTVDICQLFLAQELKQEKS